MPAQLFTISGRVQGVGFRNFVRREALALGLSGYAKNLINGDVQVLAVGTAGQIQEMAGRLAIGPAWATVRHVAVEESGVKRYEGFDIL